MGTNISIGGGFFALLTVVLVILKVIGEISISWLWVLSPLWIPPAAVCGFVVGILGFVLGVLGFVLLLLIILSPAILIGYIWKIAER